jgi:hypothetical protein
MESDRSYFMRRAAQERSAATQAQGKAREAHRQLAETYGKRVRAKAAPDDVESPATS